MLDLTPTFFLSFSRRWAIHEFLLIFKLTKKLIMTKWNGNIIDNPLKLEWTIIGEIQPLQAIFCFSFQMSVHLLCQERSWHESIWNLTPDTFSLFFFFFFLHHYGAHFQTQTTISHILSFHIYLHIQKEKKKSSFCQK